MKKTVLFFMLWVLAAAGSSRTSGYLSGPVIPQHPDKISNDASLVEKAVMAGIRTIQASEAAQTKAVDQSVLQFAARLVEEHRSANQELINLAAEQQIPVPTEAYPDKKEVLDVVNEKAGREFEQVYIRTMVRDHIKFVTLYKKGASSAENRQLRNFFSRRLPALQAHLNQARLLDNQKR